MDTKEYFRKLRAGEFKKQKLPKSGGIGLGPDRRDQITTREDDIRRAELRAGRDREKQIEETEKDPVPEPKKEDSAETGEITEEQIQAAKKRLAELSAERKTNKS